jgi:hypothetical protein
MALRRPLPLEQQPVADVDQARQPGGVDVGRSQVPGDRANPRIAEPRDDPADAVRCDGGVGVDRDHDLPAALSQRGGLGLTLALVALQQHDPMVQPGLRTDDRKQGVTVARAVVHDPDAHLTLVVLLPEGPQAGREQRRVLVVTGDDHVDARAVRRR